MTQRSHITVSILRWIGALGIVTIAVMRCLTAFSDQVFFDVDPSFDPAPMAGLGIPGSLALDALLLISAGLALFGEAMRGRGIEWKLLLLALIPVPIVLWHGWFDAGDLWRGSTWMAAAVAAVAIAHLARDTMMRLTIAALLVAVLAPLLMRGMMQMTVEHVDTVQTYEANKEAFLQDRGWEEDSPQARMYERRLRQPQPTGWFATTNIYASVLGTGVVVLLGMAIGCYRAKLPNGWFGLLVVLAALGFGGVWMSGSKGAILATLLGMVCLAPLVMQRIKVVMQRYGGVIFIILPFVALLGVFIRGAILPEGFLGEKSLLFRWHYIVGSFGIFAEHAILGVGPDHFQEAYAQYRLPRNPEEVTSAHNVFIDWLCMLGALSVAWVAIVFILLRRAGQHLGEQVEFITGSDAESFMRALAQCLLFVLIFGIVPAILFELHTLDVVMFVPRAIGAAGYIALAMAIGFVTTAVDRAYVLWPFAAGALVLVVHGQIEMTFFQPGSVVWIMCVLGLAGGALVKTTPTSRGAGWLALALSIAVALWIGTTGWLPALQQQRLIAEAAGLIHPRAEDQEQFVQQRTTMAERLLDAYDRMPSNHRPLLQAIRQFELIAAQLAGDRRTEALEQAFKLADRAVHVHDRTESYSRRASVAYQLAAVTRDETFVEQAIADARVVTARDPHGLLGWQRLGDLLWLAGRGAEAIDAYQRTLEINENFELDPLKQLPERHREGIKQRIRAYEARQNEEQ